MKPAEIVSCLVIAGLITGCGAQGSELAGSTISPPSGTASLGAGSGAASSTTIPPPTIPVPSSTTTATIPSTTPEYALPQCDFNLPTAPEDWYRDNPKYVGNEQPVVRASEWAKEHHPGFETVWIDREHHGWLVLGFTSGDVETIQTEIEAEFPHEGIVAVKLPYTPQELNAIYQRLRAELADQENMYSNGADLEHGRVSVWVGPLTEERISTVVQAAGADPVCIEGVPPDELPEPGPQPAGGEGWRLLGERDGGSFQARVATNLDQYRKLWRNSVLTGELPQVDFETEVVLWIPHTYGSSCPDIRLEDVNVDTGQGLVRSDVVNLTQDQGCTADANAYQYVVALDRFFLPPGPFVVVSDQDPPTSPDAIHIDADLTIPGSTAVGRPVPKTVPQPEATPTPLIVEAGFPYPITLDVSCGIGVIGEINDYLWETEEDGIPDEWEIVGDDLVEVEVLLKPGDRPRLTVTANGESVTYHISEKTKPSCD